MVLYVGLNKFLDHLKLVFNVSILLTKKVEKNNEDREIPIISRQLKKERENLNKPHP